MKDLNKLAAENIYKKRLEMVEDMEKLFSDILQEIKDAAFKKILKFKDKTLLVDIGRERKNTSTPYTTNVIIRIFHEGSPIVANEEEERIYFNGKATDYFNYAEPNRIPLKDFTPDQIEIMQFVKEDFEKQLESLQGEDVNEIFEEIQEDIAEEISEQEQDSTQLITKPSDLLPKGVQPANVSTQEFLRLAGQVARIQGIIDLAEKNKKSLLMITFTVLGFIFYTKDCYQFSVWLYHKLLSLHFIN
ncbi:hypothetical protein CL656_03985 [bacterium]|nr:hypothetical protein [bacterium]|tara:strand:- start:773 stop:1510 length:738 start_codon:yes stop_codon:yes gene_type:complete